MRNPRRRLLLPEPLAVILVRGCADNIRMLLPAQETVAMGFVETIRSIDQARADQRVFGDPVAKAVVRELCDAMREDGLLPGMPGERPEGTV